MAISKIVYKSSPDATAETWMDATTATASAADITAPKTAMLADGVMTTGTGSGGGGGPTAEEKDVNFIDYDGQILYSYTAAEFANLSALPANPSHTGLTAQGWNWSLTDAKTEVTNTGKLNIGQMYVTASGKTEIDIVLTAPRLSPYLGFAVNGTAVIDWGDNSATDTVTGTSLTTQQRTPHTYAAPGAYTITIQASSGTVALYGSSTYPLLSKTSSTSNQNRVYSSAVQAVRVGGNTQIGNYAFNNCYSLQSVTIPSSATSIGNYAFGNCYSLQSVTIPSSATSIGDNAFNTCSSLQSVTIPSLMTSIGNSTFQACTSLQSVTIPSLMTSIGNNTFQACYSLQSVTIPSSATSIGASVFTNCYSLGSVTIPSLMTSIGSQAFSGCYGLAEIHFKPSTPPTVDNVNAWNNIPTDCVIYVPTGKLSAYTSAANYPDSNTYTYVEE